MSLPWLYFALAVCWVSGAALLLVRLSHRHLQAQSLRSGARPAPEHVVEACREMAKRMGFKAPRVMVSPAVGSPFLMGILRPTILLPEARPSLANAHVFAHELAHLRRRDCLWSTLCRLIAALCFFQPLMWKLAGHMDQANEEACDDFVLSYVGERRAYVCRLIDMAETLGYCTSERMGIGVVNLRSSLGRRVQRILSSGTSHTVQTGHSQRLFVAMLGGLAVFFVSFLGAHAAVSVEERDSFADGAVEPDVLPLVTVLTSGEWRKREQAAIALAQMAGAKTAAIPALIEALTDEEWRVRKAAAVALTTTGPAGKGAVSALITALHDEEWHVRRPAAEALAAIGPASEPAVPALSRALSDEEWHVRRAAATALTAIGPEAATAIPTLIERLDDPEWRVRRAAAGALERIAVGDKTAIPEIIDALLDTEWKQRQAAAQSLEKLLQE